MKYTSVFIALCAAMCSFSTVHAKNIHPHIVSKDLKTTSSLFANGFADTQPLVGSPTSVFLPLTFSNQVIQGKEIKSKGNGYEFELEKGNYLIASAISFEPVQDLPTIQIAFKIGNTIHTPFSHSANGLTTMSVSQTVRIYKKSTFTTMIRINKSASTGDAINRSLTIVRLGD